MQSILKQARGFILDMDGVVYHGSKPIRTAINFLHRLNQRNIPFLLLTNHGCMTQKSLSQKLKGMGIHLPPHQFYSSAEATAEWLVQRKVRKVYSIGEEGLTHALRKNGVQHVSKGAKHVVVGLDRKMTYEQLQTACRLITSGAAFIGTNPDVSYPVEDGNAPECGAVLAAVQSATGKTPLIIGKPSKAIFQQAARRLNLPISKLIMIGDRLDTDVIGAQRAGAHGFLVLTGHTNRSMVRRSSIRPDAVLENLDKIQL